MTQCCFKHLHPCLKRLILFSELWGENIVFQNVSYLHGPIHCILDQKLLLYRKIFPTIYNISGPVSIYFFRQQNIQRGSITNYMSLFGNVEHAPPEAATILKKKVIHKLVFVGTLNWKIFLVFIWLPRDSLFIHFLHMVSAPAGHC